MRKFQRPDWDEYFMLQAELAKLRSNCVSRKVGAVIARDRRQLSTGYNGTPSGIKNCYEGGCERCQQRVEGAIESGEQLHRCMCSHAESNAIVHCAILGIGAVSGATMYTTMTPCLECYKMAVTVGIRRVVCMEPYTENIRELIDEAGVKVKVMQPGQITPWIRTLSKGI